MNIWEQQIDLKDLNFENAPDWREIKVNTGPNLHRLPDELIPAIEKFLIIARDKGDEETIADENLNELILLLKCLIIICRNFDNIKSMASNSSNFIGNILAINNRIINICFEHPNSSDQKLKVEFVKVSSNFLEAIFDPFLSWRSYQKGSLIDLKKIDYKVVMLNVEIVPFIYDYFEQKKYHHQPEISVYLLNLLGSVISGSQVSLLHLFITCLNLVILESG